MSITSNSTITNSFVPNFALSNVKDSDILIYSNIKKAFVNNDGSALNIEIDGDSILDFSVERRHLSASENGWAVGQVLTIDNSGELAWSTLPTGVAPALNMNDLLDVNDVGRVEGSILSYNGSLWTTVDFSSNNLGDFDISSALDGEMLVFDETTSKWINKTVNVADLGDVSTIVPVPDQYLRWDGSEWIPTTLPSGISTLDGLSDTDIVSLEEKQVLTWAGNTWQNSNIDYSDVSNVPDLSEFLVSTDFANVAFSGRWDDISGPEPDWNTFINVPTEFDPSSHTHVVSDITDLVIPSVLDDLTDVSLENLTQGELLSWNGSEWVNTAQSAISLDSLSDVFIDTLQSDQFLKYDGNDWVNSTISSTDIPDFSLSVISLSSQFTLAGLSDTGNPTNGYMVWSEGSVTYQTSIPSSVISGLAEVAISGSYSNLEDVPTEFNPTSHTHTLSNITDVAINSPLDKQFMRYDEASSLWQNQTLLVDDILPDGQEGQILKWAENTWVADVIEFNELTDVEVSSAVDGSFLKKVNSQWVPSGIGYSDLSGIVPEPPSHRHIPSDIDNLDAAITAQNINFSFKKLSDTAVPSEGILKWNASLEEVEYASSISSAEVSGLSTVATSGSYEDLTDKPFIPSPTTSFLGLSDTRIPAVANGWLKWNGNGDVIEYITRISANTDISDLSAVATSGQYSDISGTPNLSTLALTGQWSDILNPQPDWNTIINIPNAFVPISHTHLISEVIGLQDELNLKIQSDIDSLPNLIVDYDTQVTGNKPIVPINSSFSFVGLNDSSNANQPSRVNKYLRWDPTGQEVVYEQYIDVDVITGLGLVATTNEYTDLDNYLRVEDIIIDYESAQLINAPDLDIYAKTSDLSTVATTNKYFDLDPSSLPDLFDGNYSSLNGIPNSFNPTAHTHTASEITGIVISLDLNDLSDVNALPTDDGDVVSWDARGNKWIARPGSKLTGLIDVDDVSVPNAYLRWNTSGTEILFEENISASNITGLSTIATTGIIADGSDVSVANVKVGDALVWDGNDWANVQHNQLGVYPNLSALQADPTMQVNGKTAIITGTGIVYFQSSNNTWYKSDASPV